MRTLLPIIRPACVALVVAATATGCFGSGELPPSTTVPQTAPPVPRSLDLTAHLEKTCDLFSAADWIDLGLPENTGSQPADSRLRGYCGVLDSTSGKRLNFHLRLDRSIVREVYEAEPMPTEWRGFEPLNLRGFPGIRVAHDLGKYVSCDVQVATAERQGISLYYEVPASELPDREVCAKATDAADAVLRRLGA